MASEQNWQVVAGFTDRQANLQLSIVTGDSETQVWQPGQVKGLNVYIATNTSTSDIDYTFHKETYISGTTYSSRVDTTLFTVPAGGTGYFCFNPGDVVSSLVKWNARDHVGFGWKRTGTTGSATGISIMACVEYMEEYLYDNDYVANGGNNNAIGTFLNSGGY